MKLRIPRLEPSGTKCRVVAEVTTPKRVGRKSDTARIVDEPWRASGYGHDYRKARQSVLARQQGRCAITGQQVAERRGDTWTITQAGAGVHHRIALCDGGTDDPSNLILLSASAHARIDAERRRGEGSK